MTAVTASVYVGTGLTTSSLASSSEPSLRCVAECQRQRSRTSRYTKGHLLGRGACKTVYHAFDEENGIEVAWNEISIGGEFDSVDEKERERIFGEIRLLQQLKHKHILALHDWWFDLKNGSIVFITELLDGSLRSYRQKHKTLESRVIRRWAWQILQGLVYLHGHNPPIIHRDLKSDNILIHGASGTLKIGDLGFATFRAGFSGVMSVIGTPEFMAPELYEEKYDEKVDIYSFGLCLLELATLEYPYKECRNAAQIFKKVTAGVVPEGLSRIQDKELREFVVLCIQHDPAKRPEARQLLKHPFFEACRSEGLVRKSLAPLNTASVGVTGAAGYITTPTTPTLPTVASMPLLQTSNSIVAVPGPATPTPAAVRMNFVSNGGASAQNELVVQFENSTAWPLEPFAAANAVAAYASQGGMSDRVGSSGSGGGGGTPLMRIAAALQSNCFDITRMTGGGLLQPRGSAVLTTERNEAGDLGDDVMLYMPSVRDDSSPGAAVLPAPLCLTGSGSIGGQLAAVPYPPPPWSPHTSPARPSDASSRGRSRDCHSIDESSEDDDDVLGELTQRVRLACRNHEDSMLAFSMSFVNHQGTKQKVGFQYDVKHDTARDVADEMIENLSLNSVEAGFIASLIQKEISRYSSVNTVRTVLPPVVPAAATLVLTAAASPPSLSGGGGASSSLQAQPATTMVMDLTQSSPPPHVGAHEPQSLQGWLQLAAELPASPPVPRTSSTSGAIASSQSVPIRSALTEGLAQAAMSRGASLTQDSTLGNMIVQLSSTIQVPRHSQSPVASTASRPIPNAANLLDVTNHFSPISQQSQREMLSRPGDEHVMETDIDSHRNGRGNEPACFF